MGIASHFARDYSDARAKFLDAATTAGAAVTSLRHPLRGPGFEKLATDVAWWGPREADRVLVTMSATHGAEGFCGSGCQVAWFAQGLVKDLPRGTALLAIHAINPHGFAWLRRVTEDNVDLNRNFIDHGAPYPANPAYEELKDAICPDEWTDASLAAANARLQDFAAKHGAKALRRAISGGQYSDSDGVFFGGHAPTWSRRALLDVLARFAGRARHVATIDYHTGLGPYGHGEIIAALPPRTPGFERAQAWLDGEATSAELGTSSSAVLVGVNGPAMAQCLPQATVAAIALEYGVAPIEETLGALRADNWLHVHGDLQSDKARTIKAEVRRVFYGDADDWKQMVWDRAVDVTKRMLRGLTQS